MNNKNFIREIDGRLEDKMTTLNQQMFEVRHTFSVAFYDTNLAAIDCFFEKLQDLEVAAREVQGLLKTKATVIDIFSKHEALFTPKESEE